MKTRAVLALPLVVALLLHAWASGEYPQDVVLLALAFTAIPLGASVRLGAMPVRVISAIALFVGGAAGWEHTPEAGFGPGTLPRAASSIALGALLAAIGRLYVRDTSGRDRAGFILGVCAVAACGATRLGPGYAAFAAVYLVCSFAALRSRDVSRARASHLGSRGRAGFVIVAGIASAVALISARTIPPVHRAAVRAFEQVYTSHDMVGYGGGAWLGSMRNVIRSDEEVFRIAPPPHARPMDYLRGGVYDDYRPDGFWDETPFAAHLRDVTVVPELGRDESVRVRRLSGSANRYFVPLDARDLRAEAGTVEADELGAVITAGSIRARAWSFRLGERDDLVPAPPRPTDLRVPRALRPEITRLALQWTVGAQTPEEKIDAIQRHLRHDYEYSLDFLREADDPLLDFLFVHKQGYCTYFASALALVARAAGVPTRFVIGYRVSEWSPVAEEYVVRDRNAHAWVEAWIDGAWRTYDATPMQELPQDKPHLASLATLAADLARRIEHAVARAIEHATVPELFSILGGLLALWGAVRALRKRNGAVAQGHTDEHLDPPLPCFEELSAALAGRGLARAPSEPLDGFAERLQVSGLSDAASLVKRYSAFRYGGIGEREALESDVARFLGATVAHP